MTDIERDSFSDVTSQRLKALAARIEEPHASDRGGNLASLASLVQRLTFSEMMVLADGIAGRLPEKSVEPFALAIGLRDWAADGNGR